MIGTVRWRSTDIDGLDGKTGLGDFAHCSTRFIAGTPSPECNFDLSSSDVPGLGDLAIFATKHLSGASGAWAW